MAITDAEASTPAPRSVSSTVTRQATRETLDIFHGPGRLRPLQRTIAGLIEKKAGHIPPPMILNSFKKELFGQWFSRFLHRSMSKSANWSRMETELFAGFTSNQLNCEF